MKRVIEHYTTDNPSLTCSVWRERCMDDKCCRKANNDVFYYCNNVIWWKNNSRAITTAPVCSDKCLNALHVLYSDHIGKNMRCCPCGKYSDIDQNNLSALKLLEMCNRVKRNIENICIVPHTSTSDCNQTVDTFQGKY